MNPAPYQKYKKSDIKWVSEIPAHWEEKPLFSLASECDVPNIGMVENNLLSLSYGHIIRKDINNNDGLLPESFETYQIVEKDDIVLRLTDLQNDQRSLRSAIVNECGIITSAYCAIRPNKITPRFLSYLLRAYDLEKVFYSMGGGLRQSMKFSDLKRLPILVPPNEEQHLIASYLDVALLKTDALIDEQEKLILLLEEKRKAVISRGLTKGLDPSVPMKDSGIKWLGKVPKHWQVSTVRRIASAVMTGGTPSTIPPSEEIDDGINWYTPGDFPTDLLLQNSVKKILREVVSTGDAKVFPPNSVYIVGIGATLGKVGFVQEEASANQQVNVICPSSAIEARFLAYSLSVKVEQMRWLSNASTIGIINQEKTKEIILAVPPVNEQVEIVAQLNARLKEHQLLVSEASVAIFLLKEHRSALISAAITGKIDVRGFAKKEAA